MSASITVVWFDGNDLAQRKRIKVADGEDRPVTRVNYGNSENVPCKM